VEKVAEGVLQDYTNGEVDHEGAVDAVCQCAFACESSAVEAAVWRVSTGSPQAPKKRRRPPIPSWVKCVAVTLLRVLDEETPGQLAPGHYTGWTSPTLKDAQTWLLCLGVFRAEALITPKTL